MLKVGIAKIDITPPLGTRLAGYGEAERPAEKINDPLFATAIVFEQGSTRAVHVTLDVTQVENGDIETMKSLASEKTGVTPDHINIGVIHTHSGPQTISFEGWGDKDEKYIETLIQKVAQVVQHAAAKLVAVSVGFATTPTKVGINRRSVQDYNGCDNRASIFDDNPYDSIMTIVRFEGKDGPVATLIHCSAHATAMGNNRLVSRDWPGVMIDRVESQTKCPAIFINGAYGDSGPRTNYLRGPGLFSAGLGDGIHAVNEVGYRGATDALWTHQSIKQFFNDIDLKVLVEDIELPTAPLPSLEQARAKLSEWEPRKDQWGEGMCQYRYWQRVIEARKNETKPNHIPFRQTIIQLGPLVLIPFPGEPFSTTTLRLRKLSSFQYTICCGGTNGMYCYLPDREARHRGGYETWVSIGTLTYLLAENIDDVLVNENLRLLAKITNPV